MMEHAYAGDMGGPGAPWLLIAHPLLHPSQSVHPIPSSQSNGQPGVVPSMSTSLDWNPHLGRFRGLGWDRKFGAWRVRIFFNQKQHHVGRFRDPLTAARAYNKVVSFLYGDKAILNLVPEDDAAMDTYDIPFALREAKREAELQKSGTTSASSSTNSTSRTPRATYKAINSSGDSTTSSTSSNISSASLSQLLAAPCQQQLQDSSCQQQLQDLMRPSADADVLALSSCALLGSSLAEGGMLPRSCGMMDGSLLLSDFAGNPHAVSTAPLLGLSTGLMQLQDMQMFDKQLLLPSTLVALQDTGALAGMQFSTAPLPVTSTGPMHMFDLSANFLQQANQVPACCAQFGMPSAYAPGHDSMWPMGMPHTNNLACSMPSAHMAPLIACAPDPVTAGCAGVPMSVFPSLLPLRQLNACGGQQLNACGGVMVGGPAGTFVASNGMVVMYAPARPA